MGRQDDAAAVPDSPFRLWRRGGGGSSRTRRQELPVHGRWKRTPSPRAGRRLCHKGRRRRESLWPRLPVAVNAILEAGELLDADRTARVQPSGGDADLRAETELTAIGKLRRGVMQHDRRIDLAEEF